MKFYTINDDYLKYLKSFDPKVPDKSDTENNKPFIGTILDINDFKYFAPISSFKMKQKTNFLIKDISSIRLCFMIPIPSDIIDSITTYLDFDIIKKTDSAYAYLLREEYLFCKRNISDIISKANYVYNIGITKTHCLNYTCCDFKN